MADTSLVFWDWNGTLMDDVRYSVACLNGLLEEYGYEQRYSLGRYREIFGFPIEAYYRRAGFDFDRDPYPVLADSYMQRYNADVDACPLTAGAARALETVAGRGIRQAILSVSRQDYLVQQAGHRGIGGLFQEMLGLKDIYGAGKVDLGRQYLAGSGVCRLHRIRYLGIIPLCQFIIAKNRLDRLFFFFCHLVPMISHVTRRLLKRQR